MKPVDSSVSVAWENENRSVKVDIYKSLSTPNYYFLPQGEDTSILPEKVEGSPWKTKEIKSGQKLIAASTSEIISDIEAKGYSLVSANIQSDVE